MNYSTAYQLLLDHTEKEGKKICGNVKVSDFQAGYLASFLAGLIDNTTKGREVQINSLIQTLENHVSK